MTDPFSTGPAETGTTHSTTAAAKDEAKGVAGQAASAGSAVVGTAKDEAANVAQEAKYQVKDLLHQTRGELTDQAAAQQTRAARGLRSMHRELNSMADNSHFRRRIRPREASRFEDRFDGRLAGKPGPRVPA